MARTVILYMRDGGVFITQAHGENQSVKKLKARVGGGVADFSDSFWGRSRELVINLDDVSAIELFDGSEQEAGDG